MIREGKFDLHNNQKISETPIIIYSASPIVKDYVNSRKDLFQNVFILKNLTIIDTINLAVELLGIETKHLTFEAS